ncbi:hypothetical protein [Actinocrispum wychmicini]|uniref:Uncharacterized protein n=1 Tax=Actinocrispum wychmicini TaxID=1213861 RepID=A0A4R2K6C9_9PSEU|nr:hypothetical protein [Actinocrispum wychmicini]TCO65459.1 hypothetical protein EV192_1011251 [Actinocrispum wychmicini]
MDEILFRALVEAVDGYLGRVERIAALSSEAGIELARLVGAWRSLLGQHPPARRGRCAGCRAPGMCSVWQVAGAWFVRA